MPRHCTPIRGGTICTSGPRPPRCLYCGRLAGLLCDGKVPGTKKTCDAPMCEEHAREIGPDQHLCTGCHARADRWPVVARQGSLF